MGRRKSNQKEVVAPGSGPVDPRQMYNDIATHNFNQHTIQQLELSQTLETVLWPNYASEQGKEATLLIVILINEKFRQNASVWEIFGQSSDNFSLLFHNITRLALDKSLTITERIFVLRFLIHSFNAVETELLRNEIKRYVSMPVWVCLSQKRLENEFSQVPKLKKLWKKMEKSDKTLSSTQLERVNFERRFIANLVLDFFGCLNEIPSIDNIKMLEKEHEQIVKYCERFLEFLIDLETLLPTRRFTQVILDDMHVTTIARLSNLFSRSEDGKLFRQLLKNLKFYLKFEIDHITGEALNDFQITMRHMKKFSELQKTIFGLYGDDANFRPIYLASVSSMDSRADFLKRFMLLKDEDLINICNHLALGMENNEQLEKICSLCPQFLTKKDIVLEVLVDHFEKIESQIKVLNSLPLYPTEEVIWDENLVPSDYNENCLALPKLKIQFLTMHDYLLRNFHLFRLESAYQIRQDIESAIAHMKPWRAENGSTIFGGWARMSIAIDSFTITEVGKANIGESKPSRVKAEVVVNLNVKRPIKREWESLRKHDVCFLITVQPKAPPGTKYLFSESLLSQLGNVYVRGCEIEGMLDPTGRLIDDIALASGERPTFTSDYRTYRVWLDNNQYHMDTKSEQLEKVSKAHQQEDVYGTFNILMRRKPNENNFKAVLETIRDLMNIKFVVPDWLHDVLLGYGEPDSAHYTNLSINQEIFPVLDFYDTFLDLEHIKKSFGDYKVLVDGDAEPSPSSLFKLKIDNDTKVVTVYPYVQSLFGPSRAQVKRNLIQFTPTQVEAIRSGIQHGLTMVVGPPGTGKTDLAVQIISNLYHNHPDQRTLIVTHSNQALNAIFEKIMNLNIEERHLLRLGRGEEELETEKDFSRYGRVNYVLAKRLQLLDEVARLAKSLSLSTDFAYTCETAGYFFLYNVLAKWEAFVHKMNTLKQDPQQLATAVQTNFPFAEFFKDVQPLFVRENFEQNFEVAKECFQSIRAIFSQLEEFKPFEILRNGSERANYLLLKEAKIIAMTCTHAALKRKDLATLGFQYDNIIMEESAQILEIETFIPLLLQNPEFGHNRLKRWIMIGDHRQLPPVIQNQSFQKFSNMEQSLFTRFVRLGVPTVDLDKQARARPSISALYNWRYQNLGDLEIVHSLPEFNRPNPGKLQSDP